ncbi:hypothetical protein RvY_07593-2 [Ramazzottius varieornatus]|uniref:NR LBD domain-containing protein n=1 Tax=Ramazzottius varieornatus TaxID=947166 RepID=A0A1D1VB54_RAMVA|nr:hypothetical protein RvY_07593-2 [Ramazzottius varieornatus]
MGLEELENKLYENNNGEIAEVISLVRQCVGVLYETVLWVAQIGNAIPVRDQILLLYESWHELFLVGLFNKLRTTPIQQTLPGLQISGALEDQWYIITTVLNKLKGFKLDLVAMGRFKQLVFLRYGMANREILLHSFGWFQFRFCSRRRTWNAVSVLSTY